MWSMDKLIDETMVFALCMMLMVTQLSVELSAVGMLLSAAACLGCLLLKQAAPRICIEGVALAGCALVPSFAPFLPVIAYLCMTERLWAIRSIWILALIAAAAFSENAFFSCALAVTCVVSAVLAVRSGRLQAERRGMKAARDGLREQALGLAERNRNLVAEVNEARGHAASGRVCRSCVRRHPTDEERAARFTGLTDRENTIVALVAQGYDNREIAGELYLSEGTVRNNISSILQKKNLKNRTQIAVMYYCG